MRSGRLNRKIALQSATTAKDGHGQDIATWAGYATVWASIVPLRGNELLIAQQISAETTHIVTIYYRSDVTTEHRIKYGARIFEIVSKLNTNEANIELIMQCREVA